MRSCLLLALLLGVACAAPEVDDGAGDDELPLGDEPADDVKADGWGAATTCKPIPELPPLVQPRIVISVDGLTLRLIDDATGWEKVYPIGPGAIETRESALEYAESHTMFPVLKTGRNDFTLRPSQATPCKIWWTDPESGQRTPVFAGLPFMPFYGNYAIHGPVDNYRAPSGGNLRRGYVSHGCVRMEAADVVEVYARIRRASAVPVRVQREPERRADGSRVDVAAAWIGSECDADADCNFPGGFCKPSRFGRGFCTARCTSTCADRAGQPTTFCVADPDAAGQGMCVNRVSSVNLDCRPYDHMRPVTASRRGQPAVTARVCLPGSRGWVGDRCEADADCQAGNQCAAGLCTQACERFCPDEPGTPWTFCAAEPALGDGGHCMRQCTPASNAPECPAGQRCEARARNGQPGVTRHVCVP